MAGHARGWFAKGCMAAQSAWAFADDFCYIDWLGGMVDLLVALVLLALIAAVVEWRRRETALRLAVYDRRLAGRSATYFNSLGLDCQAT